MVRYSINDLEKLSGIKAHTLRMWEKRYGVVSPKRTDTNIRYYHDCDLKKILNISTLNRYGFKISAIAEMDDAKIREKVMEIAGTHGDYDATINNLVVSMIEFNEVAFEQTLNGTIIKTGFEKCVTRILYPFLEKVGILWLTGAINPAQEHFITNLIRQKLIVAIDGQSGSAPPDAKTFLLFLPDQELHELGLLFYSYILHKNGFRVIYLGQSVPLSDLTGIEDARPFDFLLTYFVSSLKPFEIPGYIAHLSESFPGKQIYVTGSHVQAMSQTLPKNVVRFRDAEAFSQLIKTL